MHVLRDAGKPVGAVGDLLALRGAGKPAGHDGRGGHVLSDAGLPVHGLALAVGLWPSAVCRSVAVLVPLHLRCAQVFFVFNFGEFAGQGQADDTGLVAGAAVEAWRPRCKE